MTGRSLSATVALGVSLAAGAARAAGPGVELDVTLDPNAARVSGHARLRVVNEGAAAIADVPLWLYPNHLATRAHALGDVAYHWLYPGLFSPAHMDIADVRADGAAARVTIEDTPAGARTLAIVALPSPLPPGGAVVVDVDFVTTLPRRFGGFGCDRLRCRMMGGFYPMPARLGPTGFDPRAAPAPAGAARVTVRVPAAAALVVDGTPVVWPGAGRAVTVDSVDVPYASIVTDRVLRPATATVGRHVVTYLHRRPRPPGSEGQALPYVREDITALVLTAARHALELADATMCGPPCVAASDPALALPLTLIEAPLRHQLVQSHGGVILVSDQIFNIFPLRRLRKYHELEIVRAVLAAVIDARRAGFEADADRDLGAGVLAAYLTELYARLEYHKVEYATDLLRPFDIVPAVDQLIYAPLLASSSSYFGDVDDHDQIRDDVRRFADPGAPSPRLVYNKLRDLLGDARFAALARAALNEARPLRRAAADAFGGDLGWFWRQWLGPRPRVNYRLQSVRVTEGAGGSHVVVVVRREGDAIREPVEVQVTDKHGGRQTLRWDDRADAHTFELDLPAGLASVEIDPRGRLVETALGSLRASDDPRYDDRQPPRWRLLFEGFGALFNVTALTANFELAFLLKPQHDLRHVFLFSVFRDEATELGAGGAYFWNFGAQADKNTLQSSLFGGLNVARANPTFGLAPGEAPEPGWRASGRLGLVHDSRDYLYDPWRAIGFNAGVAYTLTALEDGRRLSQTSVAGEALRLFELAPGHVLAVDGQVAATFGDIHVPGQLIGAGGPGGLRGFFADELLSRGHGIARVELRDDYVSGLDWNMLHFTTVRGFAGTVFADAAAITSCDDYALSRHGVFFDAGYSFRILHDAFGVYQQLLSIDVAAPINRHAASATCLGQPVVNLSRPPFVVLVSFFPSF